MATKLTVEQLHKEPSFISLSENHRRLVVAFLEATAAGKANPKAEAIRATYNMKSKESSRVMSYSYFGKPAIIECLAIASGLTPREAFIAELKRLLQRKSSPTQLAVLKLYGEAMGFVQPQGTATRKSANRPATVPAHDLRIPAGACGLYDKTTRELKGYRTAAGEYVQLAAVEVTR